VGLTLLYLLIIGIVGLTFSFLGERHATPYHAPLYLAQAKGLFKDEGVKVAILEPNDPSVCLFVLVLVFEVRLESC